MATGRTVGQRWTRAYVNGYDLSGYVRTVGQLTNEFSEEECTALSDAIKGAFKGRGTISVGEIQGCMDSTATYGMHEAFKNNGGNICDVMIPLGIRAAPSDGDPVFCAQVTQKGYNGELSDETLTMKLDLGSWDERGDTKAYAKPWGWLIHAKANETAASTSSGTHDYGAQTTKGGYMMYQIFGQGSTGDTCTGTITFKIQDSTGGAWSDLASSGELTQSATPQAGIVALGTTATVDRYLRWQISLNTATKTNFALAFVRGQ